MAESLFDKLQLQAFKAGVAPRTKDSQNWFRNQLKNMRNINRQRLLKDSALEKVQRPRMGDMYMFFYDAKNKDTLPYWDQFPLIIMVERAPGGFYGLNVHYLPLPLRAKFFDALLSTTNDNKFDEGTRMRVRYRMIKNVRKLKYFKPCFKHYLTDHIDSRIVKVQPSEWEVAMFLPVQRFKGATATQVWKESRAAI